MGKRTLPAEHDGPCGTKLACLASDLRCISSDAMDDALAATAGEHADCVRQAVYSAYLDVAAELIDRCVSVKV